MTTPTINPSPRHQSVLANLASSLENDIDKIYQFVRNSITFIPSWGAQKNAFSCLIDKKGNAIDQCALMISLLSKSAPTIQAKIVIGKISISAAQAASWLGTNPSDINSSYWLLFHNKIDVAIVGSNLQLAHAWVKANIGGTWYVFDPSFVTSVDVGNSNTDLVSAIGYSDTAFDTAVGGTNGSDYVQNVNLTGMNSHLATLSLNLRDWIATNNPNKSDYTLTDLIGGRAIVPSTTIMRDTALSYQLSSPAPVEYDYTALPLQHKWQLQFQYVQPSQGSPFEFDFTFDAQDISGRALTLTYNEVLNGTVVEFYPVLKLDGQLIYSSPNKMAVGWYDAKLTVSQNTFSRWAWQRTHVGGYHILANSWGSSTPEMAFYHQKILQEGRDTGLTDTDPLMVGESLSVLWHNWSAEKSVAAEVFGRLNKCTATLLHQVGLVGFYRTDPGSSSNGSPFTDLGLIGWSTTAYSPAVGGGDDDATKRTNQCLSLHGVCHEAGAIRQVSGGEAVNANKVFKLANAAGKKIFRATAANWNSSVRGLLKAGGNYPIVNGVDPLAQIDADIAANRTVYIHEGSAQTLNQWTGFGYYSVDPNNYSTPGIIQGTTSGKGSGGSLTGPLPNFNDNAGNSQTPETSQRTDNLNQVEVDYIVDTQTGNFKYHETDFTIGGQPAPWGMSFIRYHNSKDRLNFTTLGYGWRHNHMVTAIEGTNAHAALGNNGGIPGSDPLAQMVVLVQLLKRDPNGGLAFLFASLTLNQTETTLSDNIVTVRDGENTYVFTKLTGKLNSQASDAEIYAAPPGVGLGLVKVLDPNPLLSYFRMTSLDGVIWNFRPDGQISTIVYPHGVTWTYSYQAVTNLLTSVTNGIGVTIDFAYQSVGPSFLNVLKEVSAYSGTVKASFTILDKFTVSKSVGPDGITTFYEYDSKKRMLSYTMPPATALVFAGAPTAVQNTFDEQDRVIRQVNPAGTTVFFYTDKTTTSQSVARSGSARRIFTEFDDQGRAIAITEGTIKTTFQYDGLGRKRYETFMEGNSIEYVYDQYHRISMQKYNPKPGSGLSTLTESYVYTGTQSPWTTFTNKRGKVFVRTINSAGQILTEKLNGAAFQKTWTYGSYGFPATFTDETGIKTTYTEDYRGRLTQTVSSQSGGLNLLTTWMRDNFGNATSVTDPRGNTTTFTFDGQRRLIRKTETAPFSFKTEYDYDLRSNKLEERREVDAFGNWQRNKWTYSGTNKVLTATDPLGFVSKTSYDELDRLISTQDPEGRTNKFEYDLDLRITKVIDANNVDADIRTYTANGKLKTIKDARNNVSTWTFDGHDRKSRLTYPDTSYEEWQYDNNGNVTSYRTRSGSLITQTFDDYDRLATRSPASQPVETYLYDNAGRLLSVSTPVVSGDPSSGTFSRGYDVAGRLTSETNPQSQVVSYQLDANGNMTKITYPGGYFVDRVFDEMNRLTAIKLNGSTSSAAAFQYDRLSRRTKVTLLNGIVTDYQYDLADRRTGMDLTVGGVPSRWRYGFNKVDQMTSAKFPDSTWEWRPTAGTTTYGAANNLNQIPSISGGITLAYDGRGNLTGDGTWTYVFNTENMLMSATKTGTSANFDYDPSNRQIRKTTVIGATTTKTRFVYSGDQLIAEYDDTTGNLLRRYVYALGKDDPIMQLDVSNNVTYLHADHLGSIIAQSNATGAIVNKYQYSPHGQSSTTLTGTIFGFTGQRFDSELGLYHYKARYYSPALCRFLQADPAGYDVGYNLYPYAKNDPLNLVDSEGLEPEPVALHSAFEDAIPLVQQQLALLEIALAAAVTAGGSLIAGATLATTGTATGTARFAKSLNSTHGEFSVGAPKGLPTVRANNVAGKGAEQIESMRPRQRGAAREITFEDPTTGTQARIDLFKKNGSTEVKTGNAQLSDNQKIVYPKIQDGSAIPRLQPASNAGLQVGVSLNAQGIGGVPVNISRYKRR